MTKQEFWDRLFAVEFQTLQPNERRYYAVNVFFTEWVNGGLSQFFYNAEADLCEAALEGLQTMGAAGALAILRDAVSVVFGTEAPDRYAVQWPLDPLVSDKLNRLDRLLGNEENDIWDRMDKYAIANGLYEVPAA